MNIRHIDYSEFDVWPEMPEQAAIHEQHLFCFDMSCECHDEQARLTQVAQWWREGLVSSREVVEIWRGKTVEPDRVE